MSATVYRVRLVVHDDPEFQVELHRSARAAGYEAATWARRFPEGHDPDTYDPRAGGHVFIGSGNTADTLRDGLRLVAEVARLRAALEAAQSLVCSDYCHSGTHHRLCAEWREALGRGAGAGEG